MAIQGNVVTVPGPYEENLMSLPQYPTRRTAGDGTEPGGGQPNASGPPQAQGEPAPQTPTLEQASPTTTFQTIEQLVRSQDRLARNRWAIDLHYRRVDVGVPFSRLEKVPNQAIWVAKLPPGASRECAAAVPNKANDLCNKISEQLLADPPKPNPQTHVNTEGTDESGELASQFLRLDGGEAGTNDVQQYRWALRSALASSSSFLHYTVDPSGGGYQPYQVLAHPQAQDPANPLVAMLPDPLTGQDVPHETPDPVLRYVSARTPEFPEGQFVENPADADRVWLPRIKIARLRREQVRTFPAIAPIEEAQAVILLLWCTLSEGRTQWKELEGMPPEQLSQLASWRPTTYDQIVPYTFRGGMADGMSGPSVTEVGSLSPLLQRRMFYYRLYVPKCPEYPKGLQVDVSGANGGMLLDRSTLDYQVHLPKSGTDTRCREIPVVQVTPNQDTVDNDPMGWPLMSRFAGSTEATATLYAAYLDALDQRLHPHVFIQSTTPVDEDDWADRSTPIILNPGDGQVTYEQFSQLPDIVSVAGDLRTQQDTASGLTATAQGLDSDNAISGVAKQLTVRQAQVSLSGIQQQLHAAMTRGWRIKLQLAQAFFTTPQLLQYAGDDGSSEVQWFSGEDLAGIDDVGIEPGTGTMMTAEAKANYVAFLQAQQWLPADRAADVGLAGIARDLGLPPNPAEQAIERSVSAWLKGPDPMWVQQAQQVMQQNQQSQQAFQQQASVAQAQGIPMMGQPQQQPIPEPPNNPFPARPNDTEPEVAGVYVRKLSKLMLSPQYTAQPPEWRMLVDQKYLAARQALAPPPQAQPGQPAPAPPAQLPAAA